MSNDDFAHNPITLLHIASELRKRGISPVEIFRRAGLSPARLLDGDRWIPRALCFALGQEVAAVSGDPFFASRIGKSFQLAEFGVWGQTIESAETVADAFSVAIKGVGLLHRGSSLQVLVSRDEAQLKFAYRGRLGADPRQHLMGTLAVLRKIALLANVPEAVGVHFSIPYSIGADCLEETHGERLTFGCDTDAIVVDRELLGMRLDVPAEPNGRGADEPPETAEQVGALIRKLLPYERANLPTVAAKLNVSKRTLQRRLRNWGFAFEEILDDTRRTEALKLVRSREHSAIEIAFLLGYSDAAHFTRAFRRWTGMSPREYSRAVTRSLS
ncbi:helix-turn-helix transcriptional regulator [Microbaculum marinisediminis]|uniref:AraC family transcriptional regulator n=1 Tax=Microbaculum marinisediminis TaxID=2931392 RepID=A0AAW5R1K2_9HYPH|nr:AraC family transcriptional regulator [Microbaculum sp. A6E488]MCT8972538.1 AraC family transcriptional regulator [Microbaculum sp. A6E488]